MATKQERRIAVIKDAIKQIKINNYAACSGRVFATNAAELNSYKQEKDEDVQKILKKLLKTKNGNVCSVCARGALLVSTVHKENNFTLSDLQEADNGSFDSYSTTDKRLMKLFSKQQLALMETAFETDDSMNNHILSQNLIEKAVDFGLVYDDENERLLAILQNAVKNGGIFKP